MVKCETVDSILDRLRDYRTKLDILAGNDMPEFAQDFTKVESAKHLFQVSVECCLDVSNHIIASERFRAPKSYAESFEILAEQGIIPEPLIPTLRKMVQFRNRLVHLYWEVDAEIIYEILQKNLGDFDILVNYILGYIASQRKD